MSFDRVAGAYHPLELLTFGTLLRRTREHFLPSLLGARSALILGDGDGRFLYALLRANPDLHALVVDSSPRMLQTLATRCHPFASRIHLLQADLRQPASLLPALRNHAAFDLVTTHFVLDCLTTPQIRTLLTTLQPFLAPGVLWAVSEFRIPPRGPIRPLAALLVRSLYLAFRLLTGLRITRLPDHHSALQHAGLSLLQHHELAKGLLVAELWRHTPPA